MSKLNSNFDIISHDPHPNAGAGLLTVLEVNGASGGYGTPSAGNIDAGTLISMNTSGKAVKADNSSDYPTLTFITIDGDKDFDGAFVHKITCVKGGEFLLDAVNYDAAPTYTAGLPLMAGTGATAGKFTKATAGKQIIGYVGAQGEDTTNNTLHVIMTQGVALMPTP